MKMSEENPIREAQERLRIQLRLRLESLETEIRLLNEEKERVTQELSILDAQVLSKDETLVNLGNISVYDYMKYIHKNDASLSEQIKQLFDFCIKRRFAPQKYSIFGRSVLRKILGLSTQGGTNVSVSRRDDDEENNENESPQRVIDEDGKWVSPAGKQVVIKLSIMESGGFFNFVRFFPREDIDFHLFVGYDNEKKEVYTFLVTPSAMRDILPRFGDFAYKTDKTTKKELQAGIIRDDVEYALRVKPPPSNTAKGARYELWDLLADLCYEEPEDIVTKI